MQIEPDASVCKLPGERAGENRLVVENLSTFYGETPQDYYRLACAANRNDYL